MFSWPRRHRRCRRTLGHQLRPHSSLLPTSYSLLPPPDTCSLHRGRQLPSTSAGRMCHIPNPQSISQKMSQICPLDNFPFWQYNVHSKALPGRVPVTIATSAKASAVEPVTASRLPVGEEQRDRGDTMPGERQISKTRRETLSICPAGALSVVHHPWPRRPPVIRLPTEYLAPRKIAYHGAWHFNGVFDKCQAPDFRELLSVDTYLGSLPVMCW